MNIGLIGCGGIGALRAAAVAKTDGFRLRSVADVSITRAHALAQRFETSAALGWEDLLGNPGLDAVVVSTPPDSHAEIVAAALRAGKHVLCEKPIARNPREAQHMVDTAQAADRLLATGFNYRFYPSVMKARELFDSGLIGELDHVRAYAGYSATDHNPVWVHDADIMGGGALRDNGIHLLDLTRYFLGEVKSVKGDASNHTWGFADCEDNGFALLRGENGRVASLHASWTEWAGYRFLIEIYGSRGCIKTWCFPMRTEAIWAAQTGGKVQRRTYRFLPDMIREHLGSYRALVVDSFVRELRAFRNAVNGIPCRELATGYDGLRTIEIAAAVAHAPGARPQIALVNG